MSGSKQGIQGTIPRSVPGPQPRSLLEDRKSKAPQRSRMAASLQDDGTPFNIVQGAPVPATPLSPVAPAPAAVPAPIAAPAPAPVAPVAAANRWLMPGQMELIAQQLGQAYPSMPPAQIRENLQSIYTPPKAAAAAAAAPAAAAAAPIAAAQGSGLSRNSGWGGMGMINTPFDFARLIQASRQQEK